ncbi:MAG: hypothetical protein GKS06_09385 [Acidobacteria bacterium]|nr:hypothetical protein [Acidobacteriota bacterium]
MSIRRVVPVLLTALLLVTSTAGAQSDLPEPVRLLLGDWQGEGELMGRPARFTMSWSHALGDRFVRLRFSNAFVVDGAEQTVLTAEAFYRVESPTSLTGVWVDSRGLILPLRAEIVDGALVTEWGDSSTERGRTRYAATDDQVEVTDTVFTEAGERGFGQAVYTRGSGR